MEANNEMAPETPDVPTIEQGMVQDTQESNPMDFNEIIGAPQTEEVTPEAQDTPQPVLNEHEAPTQDFSANEVENGGDNDQVRYQYWQSQAAKLQNQVEEMKEYQPMVDYLRSNPEAVQNLTPGGQKPEGTAPTSQAQEEFPPPPERPEQPTGFSREEAYGDPASTSAKYLDEVDKWRDDMQTYNQLASQYQVAVLRETYNKKIENLEKVEQDRAAQQQQAQQMNEVKNYVATNYDLGDRLDDFLTTMNDPNSINMDDLVGYYKYKNGMGVAPAKPNATAQPSSTFNQLKRAQSVPQPMGVQSAQSNQPTDPTDGFMDALLKNNNKQNIL